MELQIIQKRKFWYVVSSILFVASIVLMVVWGMKFGIDFTGGSLMEVQFNQNRPSDADINEKLKDLNLGNIQIQSTGDQEIIMKMRFISNDEKVAINDKFKEFGDVEILSFESIGPSIGKELAKKAGWALAIVIISIICYIAWSFRKVSMGPVPSWVYGVCSIIALVHDIIITIGFYVVFMHFLNIEIDSLFISALLTILGYSVNDTIVVYDRIRENLRISKADNFELLINESVNQTLTRSLNTGLCALFVLLALALFGGDSIKYFALTLFIGIVAGTYSSIFIASPLLLLFQKKLKR
jgi:preprotein translocase subunit SecF